MLYILNKKVKVMLLEAFAGTTVNENDIFSEELSDKINNDDIGSVASGEIIDDDEKIEIGRPNIIFDQVTAIFHVDDNANGKILKCSKSVYNVFG